MDWVLVKTEVTTYVRVCVGGDMVMVMKKRDTNGKKGGSKNTKKKQPEK